MYSQQQSQMKPAAEYELYKRIQMIGEGSYGKAFLVQGIKDGKKWVIKQISLEQMTPDEQQEAVKEAKILEQLNHPNIVKFKEIYKTKSRKLCIVMEYADGGDLSGKVQSARGQYFAEEQILDWFTQICLAIKHVHDRKVLHRDLKSQNIFLTANSICKLGDFGIAKVLSKTFEKAKTMVGTPYYLSPEIISGVPYSFKSDIWSLGVILYELSSLRPPFTGTDLKNLASNISKGEYPPIPKHYSFDMKSLVKNLLSPRPESRYSVHEILALPYLKNRIKNFLTETIKMNEFSHTILHNQKIIIDDNIKNVKIPNEFPQQEIRPPQQLRPQIQQQPQRIQQEQIQYQPQRQQQQPLNYQPPPNRAPLFPPVNPQRPLTPNQRPLSPNQRPLTPNQRPITSNQRSDLPNQRPGVPNQRFDAPNQRPEVPSQKPQPYKNLNNENNKFQKQAVPSPNNQNNQNKQNINTQADQFKKRPSKEEVPYFGGGKIQPSQPQSKENNFKQRQNSKDQIEIKNVYQNKPQSQQQQQRPPTSLLPKNQPPSQISKPQNQQIQPKQTGITQLKALPPQKVIKESPSQKAQVRQQPLPPNKNIVANRPPVQRPQTSVSNIQKPEMKVMPSCRPYNEKVSNRRSSDIQKPSQVQRPQTAIKAPIQNNNNNNRNNVPLKQPPSTSADRGIGEIEEISKRRIEHLKLITQREEQKLKQLQELQMQKKQQRQQQELEIQKKRQQMKQDIEFKRSLKQNKIEEKLQKPSEQENIQIEWMGTLKPTQPPEKPEGIEKEYEAERKSAEAYNLQIAQKKQKQKQEMEKQRIIESQQRELEKQQKQNISRPVNYTEQNESTEEMSKMLEEMKLIVNYFHPIIMYSFLFFSLTISLILITQFLLSLIREEMMWKEIMTLNLEMNLIQSLYLKNKFSLKINPITTKQCTQNKKKANVNDQDFTITEQSLNEVFVARLESQLTNQKSGCKEFNQISNNCQ